MEEGDLASKESAMRQEIEDVEKALKQAHGSVHQVLNETALCRQKVAAAERDLQAVRGTCTIVCRMNERHLIVACDD